METFSQRRKSAYLLALKWLPVFGVLLIAIHYSLLFAGIRTPILDYVTDTSLFAWIYLYLASLLFFCRLHRHFVYYIGIASLDVDLRRWFGWETEPRYLVPLIMIILGYTLVLYALGRRFRNCDAKQ